MKESTDRPAWTSTIWQGMGRGLEAFKHRIVRRKSGESEIIRDYDWQADANNVKAT